MRMRTVFALAGAVCAFVAANAQQPLGVLVRAGLYFPSSGTGSSLGTSWFTAGAELDLFKLKVAGVGPVSSRITVSVDTYTKGGGSSVPILLNYVGQADRIKYSAGAGVSIADLPGFNSSVRFAYQLSLGYELPAVGFPLLGEVRFFGVNGVGSALDGFAFTVGIRL